MNSSKMEIKFKNGKKKEFDVLLKISSSNGEYVIYTLNEKKSDKIIVYAGRMENNEIHDLVNDDEKEMILKVLDNFNKGV